MDLEEHDSSSEWSSDTVEISRRVLFTFFKDSNERKLHEKSSFMELKVRDMMNCPQSEVQVLNRDLKHFKYELKKRWVASNYIEERFLNKNEEWLNEAIPLHKWTRKAKPPGPGRPSKDFTELCERSKRRKTSDLREQVPVHELTYAASVSQRQSGNAAASKLILDATSTPTRAQKYRKILRAAETPEIKIKKHSLNESIILFTEGDFNRRQWELLHESNKSIYPCYTLIREAKKQCYPKQEAVRVTETCAEVVLQDLLDHTVTRLCLYLEEIIEKCSETERMNIELICKWGCDGSHQTPYQQKFSESSHDDSHIFQSSMVPIRLQSRVNDKIKILWQNPTPSSTFFCRPIRIRFLHETVDITVEDIKYIEDQAAQLVPTEIERPEAKVRHILLPTMVDGKVCNSATGTTSTMKCYICGKTSKDFNDFENTSPEDPQALRFGLSILHARIRLFETILHIAYKLPIKKWQARSAEEKLKVKEKKIQIQNAYRERTGLIIDMPKAGFGNSNSGNTSRRFFSDPELAAEITGVNRDFIVKLKVILEAVSSGHLVNENRFSEFCKETAKVYVENYNWHPMTPTFHKILVHGPTVIKHAILPIGQLSEEAAEARNKHYRSYRQDFARKFSRVQCNQDVFNRLLLSSDPFISCQRRRKPSKSQPFMSETIALFEPFVAKIVEDEHED